MPPLGNETKFWRSLADWQTSGAAGAGPAKAAIDDLVAREFPDQASELSDPVSRRNFMQLMGASLAFAGIAGAGCRRWEKDEIVPLSTRPPDYVPGTTRGFATAMELSGVASGLVVASYDGRPIKIEGNGLHPFLAGPDPANSPAAHTSGSSAFAQASILGLYDPDRSGEVHHAEGGGWPEFIAAMKALRPDSALRVLTEATSSPTVARLRDELLRRFPNARWHEYDPMSLDNERLGTRQAFGQTVRPLALLDRTSIIVAADADLFYFHPAALRYSKDYAEVRDPDSARPMTRLYAIESAFSTAGAKADHRLAVPSSDVGAILAKLEAALAGRAPQGDSKAARFVTALTQDLSRNFGRGVIIVGHRQPPAVHALVARINHAIGAVSNTLEYLREPPAPERLSHIESMKTLCADMQAGKVDTLLCLGGNPCYDAPADLDFAGGLARVKTSVHLSEYVDETSAACTWHVPRAHYLESWGDARAYDGTITLQQPLIEPLWNGRSSIELLSLLVSGDFGYGRDLVRATLTGQLGGGSGPLGEAAWRRALHDGFVAGSRYESIDPGAPGAADKVGDGALPPQTLEVVFSPSSHTYDGRFANNGWLQETPDFMTKLTWDNAALVNPNTADELGVGHGDMVRIELADKAIEVPVYTMPGQARNSIALALGHGRSRAGRIGGSVADKVAPVGFDVYRLRQSAAMYIVTGARVTRLGKSYPLASTQEHWKMDKLGQEGIDDRMPTLVRSCNVADYQAYKAAEPEKKHEHCFGESHEVEMPLGEVPGHGKSLWTEHRYDHEQTTRPGPDGTTVTRASQYRWGMSIDLEKCTGCNACMLACQSENNVPVVGKEQVMKTREMHWIRIDRYFTGAEMLDDPRIAFQPIACQQCEMAPCEEVCPVGATVHSNEGLNDMTYNRCIGTRYCENNCPYKVRRFNFLNWHYRKQAPGGPIDDARNKVRQLLFNPEVTVRARGVMEKCNFCVQRIQNHKITAKNEGRKVRDLEIQTACQQACPTNAIVFGDLGDPESQVSQKHRLADPRPNPPGRGYELLREFNNKTRNIFLAEVRNPNPALEPGRPDGEAGHERHGG